MKTFKDASRVFSAGSLSEAEKKTKVIAGQYRELISEISGSREAQRNVKCLIESVIMKNESEEEKDPLEMLLCIGMTALIHGVMIGIEMERITPTSNPDDVSTFN